MHYLQSRYYDPKIGRFINADSYTSTGQGFIGYNMFAYCNNDPIDNYDPSGTLLRNEFSMTQVDPTGNDLWIKPEPLPGYIGSEGQKINQLIGDAFAANSLEDIKDVLNRAEKYAAVQRAKDIYGGTKTARGLKKIGSGFALVAAPAPTLTDEAIGLYQIVYGSWTIITGLGEVVF